MINIDCLASKGRGGILRVAIPLSSIIGYPIHLTHIRSGRGRSSGLGGMHVSYVNFLGKITKARMQGVFMASEEIFYEPGTLPRGGSYFLSFDEDPFFRVFEGKIKVTRDYQNGKDRINVPVNNMEGGKYALCGQAISNTIIGIVPILLFADGETSIEFRGGTEVGTSSSILALQLIYKRILELMGAKICIEVIKRGVLGLGGGKVLVTCWPLKAGLKPINLVFGDLLPELQIIECVLYCFGLIPESRVVKQIQILERRMEDVINTEIKFRRIDIPDYPSQRIEIVVILHRTEGFPVDINVWGEESDDPNILADFVGERISYELEFASPVTRFIGDQLIPLMGLASGFSTIEVSGLTDHILSSIAATEKLLGVCFDVESGVRTKISVKGVGYEK